MLPKYPGPAGSSSGGTQQAGVPRHQDLSNAQFIGNGTGMLGTSSAKGKQGVISGVAAIADGDGADGFRHTPDGNLEEALQQGGIVWRHRQTLLLHL